jgi:hypothetical protein
MIKEKIILADTYVNGATITNAFGKIVALQAASPFVRAASAATDTLYGVIYSGGQGVGTSQLNASINAGEIVHMALEGIAMVRLGATVAAGAKLTANAAGEAITATTGNNTIGVALLAGVAGEYVPMKLGASALA